ncbi:MAG: hypothetical protein WCY37_02625 [Candidatus Dojkabacteria bacterium]
MTYLSFIIALVQIISKGETDGLSFAQGLDIYLDRVVRIERVFLFISLGLAAVVLLAVLVAILFGRQYGETSAFGFTCGCWIVFLVAIWPILEGVTYWIATGLASSVGPDSITNPTKFILLTVLMIILGAG